MRRREGDEEDEAGAAPASASCPSQLETVCGEGRSEKRVRVMRDEDTESCDEDAHDGGDDDAVDQRKKDPYPYISRVRLNNFMCHANFTTDLSNKINFIGGDNGSGKSSILAAIAFGFGVRAEATGRAQSNKDFVGPHEDRATVALHVVQVANDKYLQKLPQGNLLPEEFIIERSVWKTGRSEIKIMDRNRKVLSTKKDDLNSIRKHLNYQVDNPAVVLHQKVAKEFLLNADPKEFYQLFLRATQIDAMDAQTVEGCKLLEEIGTISSRMKEDFEILAP